MSNASIDHIMSGVSTPTGLLRFCKESGLGQHPFFRRGDIDDLRYVWLLFRYATFKDHLVRLMTSMIENTPNDEIRSLLVGQMEAERGHLSLQDSFLAGLAPWATPAGDETMAAARDAMIAGLDELFVSKQPLRSLGGYLAGEVSFGCHLASYIIRIAGEKGDALAARAKGWIDEHAMVEDGHQDEALRCAVIVEREYPEHQASFIAGARDMLALLWNYFDALNSVRWEPNSSVSASNAGR